MTKLAGVPDDFPCIWCREALGPGMPASLLCKGCECIHLIHPGCALYTDLLDTTTILHSQARLQWRWN